MEGMFIIPTYPNLIVMRVCEAERARAWRAAETAGTAAAAAAAAAGRGPAPAEKKDKWKGMAQVQENSEIIWDSACNLLEFKLWGSLNLQGSFFIWVKQTYPQSQRPSQAQFHQQQLMLQQQMLVQQAEMIQPLWPFFGRHPWGEVILDYQFLMVYTWGIIPKWPCFRLVFSTPKASPLLLGWNIAMEYGTYFDEWFSERIARISKGTLTWALEVICRTQTLGDGHQSIHKNRVKNIMLWIYSFLGDGHACYDRLIYFDLHSIYKDSDGMPWP